MNIIKRLKAWYGTRKARRLAVPAIAVELGRLNERLEALVSTLRDIGRATSLDLTWIRNDISAAILKRKPQTKGGRKK